MAAAPLAGRAADLGGNRFRVATGNGELAVLPALSRMTRLAMQQVIQRSSGRRCGSGGTCGLWGGGLLR